MQFMHIVSYFFVLATFSLSVIANPVTAMGANAQRRANSAAVTADVMSVLNELKGTTDVILPQISSALAESKPNVESVSTLIVQLINALDKTGSNLVLLPSLEKRQDSGNSTSSDDPVADLLAGIISTIGTALAPITDLGGIILPELEVLLSSVDASLNQVLVGVDTLLAGVLNLVASLLGGVVDILQGLALTLSLSTLNL